jgi:hypothetical protein
VLARPSLSRGYGQVRAASCLLSSRPFKTSRTTGQHGMI